MPKNKTMRITGGSLVRRRFLVPPAVDENLVRPTPDRVREAVFSIIQSSLSGAKILDIFAGSGAHGFEAISRGATSVVFVELNTKIASVIKENIELLGLKDFCQIVLSDAKKFILGEPTEKADIIFLDPPYLLTLDENFFTNVAKHLADDGIIIFRCHKKNTPKLSLDLHISKDRIYGSTRVFFLQHST